jgi:hypothetical protein
MYITDILFFRIGGVMVRVLASSAVDLGQAKPIQLVFVVSSLSPQL